MAAAAVVTIAALRQDGDLQLIHRRQALTVLVAPFLALLLLAMSNTAD